MTQMPQMVALFNGVGGGAAALVAAQLRDHRTAGPTRLARPRRDAFTILVGSVSFAGSIVTFAKLQELMTSRPVVFPRLAGALRRRRSSARSCCRSRLRDGADRLVTSACVGRGLLGLARSACCSCCPVGGADVPIVISLLNAFTGLTVAAGGYVLANALLLVAGTLVGASGTFLTLLMAQAMGRSVANILFGALKGGSTLGAGEAVRPAGALGEPRGRRDPARLRRAVIIVPGYGLAVAQAQHTLRELVDVLSERGIEVDYAIHPVAGRMPGHMNVLLAEAQVPYEQLKEMDDINGEFKHDRRRRSSSAPTTSSTRPPRHPGRPDLRHADPQRRRGAAGRLHEALDAPRLRRHRERAALRAEDHAALRRRQGLHWASCSPPSRPSDPDAPSLTLRQHG